MLILGNSQGRIISEIIYTNFCVAYINTRFMYIVFLCSLSSAKHRAVQTCMLVHMPMSTRELEDLKEPRTAAHVLLSE